MLEVKECSYHRRRHKVHQPLFLVHYPQLYVTWILWLWVVNNFPNRSAYISKFVYLFIWGFGARQHLRSLAPVMNEYGWQWWPNDIRGSWGPKASRHLSYRWGKTPKKPHPGNLSRPGIEPGSAAWQVRMLPPAPQRCTTFVIELIKSELISLYISLTFLILMFILQQFFYHIFYGWTYI